MPPSYRGKDVLRRLLALLLSTLSAPAFGGQETAPLIHGYTDRLSYQPGDSVALHVSTSAPTFSVVVRRAGGKGAVIWTKNAIPGAPHPVPDHASAPGCSWA